MSVCSNIPEINYREFSQKIAEEILGERIPIVGGIDLTFHCNFRCRHCYVPKDERSLRKEMTTQQIFRILDEIADEGCLWLLLTGGEPLLRKDFLDIYIYAKKKGMLVTIFTNGSLITEKVVKCFQDLPPYLIEITLYGITEQTYDRVTQTKGNLSQCLRGINLLLEAGIPLKLKTVAMNSNKHELWEIKRFAENRGIAFRFDAVINPGLDGSKGPCQERISPEEVVRLDVLDSERPKEWAKFTQSYQRIPEDPASLYYCGAGINCFNIDAQGRLALCLLAREPSYDLLSGSFREGWRNFLYQARMQKVSLGKCSTCDKVSLCGYCPGWAQIEGRNPKEPLEYLCRIAHLREKVLLASNKGGEENG